MAAPPQHPSKKDSHGQAQISISYGLTPLRLLRDAEGKKVIDPVTGTGRRVDHAVIDREANTAKTYETTGMNVNKKGQIAREQRIRDTGGTS